MVNINEFLQNKGYTPNKEMSNEAFTAYNIDSFGEETFNDALVINNHEDTWYDKNNKTKGKLVNIVINLGIANDYRGAYTYIKGFVSIIPEWKSESTCAIEKDQKGLDYKEFVKDHIFKLQTFALMVKEYFNNNKYGQHYIENFKFSELIVDDEFINYFLAQQPLEKDKELNKIKPKPITRAYLRELRSLSKEMNSQLKDIQDTLNNIEMKEFMKEEGYE